MGFLLNKMHVNFLELYHSLTGILGYAKLECQLAFQVVNHNIKYSFMQNEKTDLCVKVHITPAKTIAINEQQFKQSNYNTSHSIKSKLVFNLGKYRNVVGWGL